MNHKCGRCEEVFEYSEEAVEIFDLNSDTSLKTFGYRKEGLEGRVEKSNRAESYWNSKTSHEELVVRQHLYCPECTTYRRDRMRMALDAAKHYAKEAGRKDGWFEPYRLGEFLLDWSYDHGPRGEEHPNPPEYDGDF